MKCKFTLLQRGFVLSAFLLFATGSVFAQKTVTGTVTDASGPVIGASVIVQGTTTGVATGVDGTYSIRVPNNAAVLEFGFIGYQSVVETVGERSAIDVTLALDATQIDDVVVIGYGTVRRRDLTGAVGSVSSKIIADIPVSNAAQALQGKLAGVNVSSQDGRPGADVSIRVRGGGGSIIGNNQPLGLIDGVAGSLNDVPTDMIQSIDVLKDAASTAIYGARGANGIIIVTTKKGVAGKPNITYSSYAKFNTPEKYVDALSPYDYLALKWSLINAYPSGGPIKEAFQRTFGIGDYTSEKNSGGIETYKNVAPYEAQKDTYGSSFSHNHDLSISSGNDQTRVLFSVGYNDEQGMKIQSWQRRAIASLKVDQRLAKNLNMSVDLRWVDRSSVGNEGVTSGAGSIVSGAYRHLPISYETIMQLGDISQLVGIANDDAGVLYEYNSPKNRLLNRENLSKSQNVRGTASLSWSILRNLTARSELTLSRRWSQTQDWQGPLVSLNYYEAAPATEENPTAPYTDIVKSYAGDADYRKQDSWSMRWANTLSYDWVSKNNDHRLNVMVGHEVTDENGTDMRIQAKKFSSNYTKENAFAMIRMGDMSIGQLALPQSKIMPERMLSFFGRANYSLMDRYLLTVTMRADGSSNFAPSNRWGYFPGAAVAWRLSEEDFLKNSGSWLTDLKLRLSYGSVGNDNITPSLWKQEWEGGTASYALDNVAWPNYTISSMMSNPGLRWETTITRNVGLDYTLFKGRLWGSVDYYMNTTKDLLMAIEIPQITGFSKTMANMGQTSNRGVELALNGTILQNKDWNISAGVNISFNKGKVDELIEGMQAIYGTGVYQGGYPSNDYRLIVGQPVGIMMGYQMDGKGYYTPEDFDYDSATGVYTLKSGIADLAVPTINYQPGDETLRPSGQTAYPGAPKFKDVAGGTDGGPDGKVNEMDVVQIGNANPKHTGGFNVNASWKNLDLGLYFNWSYGNDIYNAAKMASLYHNPKGGGLMSNRMEFVNQAYKYYDIVGGQSVRVTDPAGLNALNANAKYPVTQFELPYVGSLCIEDGSYLRLNTVTLGYTLPKRIVSKIGITNLRLYGSIYNALTITGYSGLDPEVSVNNRQGQDSSTGYPTPGLDWGAYPRARQFVLGLNLNF